MGIELLLHQFSPRVQEDDLAELEPSVLSNICQGIFMFMRGWYPTTTTDTSESSVAMAERDILIITPLGLTAIAHYWSFDPITSFTEQSVASNPSFNEAARLIRNHERSLRKEAGALTFYPRAITGYLDMLQKPLEQIDRKIAELIGTNPDPADLTIAKEERASAIMQLKEQLGNFESFDSASFIGLFKQMIWQAVMTEAPLRQNGELSDEIPLGLHTVVGELEKIQQIQDPAAKQGAVEAVASRLHQGSPLCVQPLCREWNKYLRALDFIRLKTKILSL